MKIHDAAARWIHSRLPRWRGADRAAAIVRAQGAGIDRVRFLARVGEAVMAVYVDGERNRFGRMVMCHMFADTAEELHHMADAIGSQRRWYQAPDAPRPASFPHYDVSLSRRQIAVEKGAIEVDRRRGYEIRKAVRQRIIQDHIFAESWSWLVAQVEGSSAYERWLDI